MINEYCIVRYACMHIAFDYIFFEIIFRFSFRSVMNLGQSPVVFMISQIASKNFQSKENT